MHHNLSEGRKPQNFKRRENSAGLSQLSWQPICTQTFQTQASRFYWLTIRTCGWAYGCTSALVAAIPNESATDSWNPFALLTTETSATATSFWTISIQTCRPVLKFGGFNVFGRMQHTFRKTIWQLGMHCSKLKTGSGPMHKHSTYQYYIYIKHLYTVNIHLYHNHINLSNKSYSDMAKSLYTGIHYGAWSWPRCFVNPWNSETSYKLNWSSLQHS